MQYKQITNLFNYKYMKSIELGSYIFELNIRYWKVINILFPNIKHYFLYGVATSN